jgi:hypothetical protein
VRILVIAALAALSIWLAVERSKLMDDVELLKSKLTSAEKSLEHVRAELNRAPEAKTWIQSRIETRNNPLETPARSSYLPFGGAPRPATPGSRIIR